MLGLDDNEQIRTYFVNSKIKVCIISTSRIPSLLLGTDWDKIIKDAFLVMVPMDTPLQNLRMVLCSFFYFLVERVLLHHFGRVIVGKMSEHPSQGIWWRLRIISYGFYPLCIFTLISLVAFVRLFSTVHFQVDWWRSSLSAMALLIGYCTGAKKIRSDASHIQELYIFVCKVCIVHSVPKEQSHGYKK